MTTTITDATELQAMEDDLDEDYVLGNNIDASATSGWNGGEGFDPVGETITLYISYIYPTSDTSQSGTWGSYPDDSVYWNKIDEVYGSSDGDTTYITQSGGSSKAIFGVGSPDTTVPNDAYGISVRVYIVARDPSGNTNQLQAIIKIGGTEYLSGDGWHPPGSTYRTNYWAWATNPNTGLAWTVSDVNASITNLGIACYLGNGTLRITQAYVAIRYTLDHRFTGTFDGAEYTISDLYINRPTEDDVGLFGYATLATIQDVTLSSVDITGDDNAGALIGTTEGCTISNCHSSGAVSGTDEYIGGLIGYALDSGDTHTSVDDCSSSCTVGGDNDIGGLIGYADEAATSDSFATGAITSVTEDAGGLIGWADSNTVSDCYATGNVGGTFSIGGLLGYCPSSTIHRCYATGDITGTDDYVGGLLGDGRDMVVYRCYATGNVIGIDDTGGLIGDSYDGSITDCYARGNATGDDNVGGLVGRTRGTTTLDNCHSTGIPTGSTNVGGLLGLNYNDTGTITNCFWDTETSGAGTSDGGTGKTTTQMKTLATFLDVGWDIGGSGVNRNDGYPFLHWESGGAVPIWQIWQDPDVVGKRSWTIPDLKDYKGRAVKNARVRAFRVDTHALVETEITDANGSATFTDLPNDVDVVFHAHWGG